MTIFTTVLTFMIVWWLILFMVLPFGAAPPEDVVPGTTRSAPARPRLLIKFLVTTVLAVAVTYGIQWFVASGLVDLRPPKDG